MKKVKRMAALVLTIIVCMTAFPGCSKRKPTSPSNSAPAPVQSAPTAEDPKAPFDTLVLYTDGTPGSIGDTIVRTIAEQIEVQSNVTVRIENVSGGSGTNVMTEMMNNKKEVCAVAHTCSLPLSWITGTAAYGEDELTAVSSICMDYNVVITSPDSPFNNWDDVVAYAKDHPGELTWGGTGTKGSQQLLYQLFMDDLGIDIEYIPYDGAANVRVAALAGDISFGSCTFGNVLLDVADGVYKGLVVTSPAPFDAVPDLQLASEAGVPSADGNGVWRAFFCPSSYDEATIEYISELLENAKHTDAWDKMLADNNQVRWDLPYKKMTDYIHEYLDSSSTAISHIQ